MSTVRLSPEEACRRLDVDPRSFVWKMSDFILQLGMSQAELHRELTSGRLIAEGVKTDTGFKDVCVNGENLLRWMATKKGSEFWHRAVARVPS